MRSLSILCLENGVKSCLHACRVAAETLQLNAILQVFVGQAEHLHCLWVSDESTFHAKSFVCNSFANLIESINLGLLTLLPSAVLLLKVFENFLASLFKSLIRAARQSRSDLVSQRRFLFLVCRSHHFLSERALAFGQACWVWLLRQCITVSIQDRF